MIAAAHDRFHRWLRAATRTLLAGVSCRFGFSRVFVLPPTLDPLAAPSRLPAERGARDAIVLPFLLHGVSEEAQRALIERAGRLAPYLVLLEYRCPERNLDFPARWLAAGMERLANAEHRGAWRRFMAKGGVEALVHADPTRATLLRVPACGGAASLVVTAGADLAARRPRPVPCRQGL